MDLPPDLLDQGVSQISVAEFIDEFHSDQLLRMAHSAKHRKKVEKLVLCTRQFLIRKGSHLFE